MPHIPYSLTTAVPLAPSSPPVHHRFSISKRDIQTLFEKTAALSLFDFESLLSFHNRRSNNLPMRPLVWLSPSDFLGQSV